MKLWLKHYHYDVFEPFEIENNKIDTTGGGSLYFNFHTNNEGSIDGLHLNVEHGLDPLFFEREFVELKINTNELEQYIGAYDLGGAMAKVTIEDDSNLHITVPGQPEYTLIPSKKHKFILKGLDGYSVEFEEKDEKIVALTFMQPNGNFRVPKKL